MINEYIYCSYIILNTINKPFINSLLKNWTIVSSSKVLENFLQIS